MRHSSFRVEIPSPQDVVNPSWSLQEGAKKLLPSSDLRRDGLALFGPVTPVRVNPSE